MAFYLHLSTLPPCLIGCLELGAVFQACGPVAAASLKGSTCSFMMRPVRLFIVCFPQKENDCITVAFFIVEFVVGFCMLAVVGWLLLFRLKEVKECWKIHARIRFYFVLTLVGIAVNLGIGICGTVNLAAEGFV